MYNFFIMKYADLKFGEETLKFFDENKVELKSFTLKDSNPSKVIRYFRKKDYAFNDKQGKIISRSGFSGFRDPFEIEAWNQILIDEANVYGTAVDNNKEKALKGEITDDEVMIETRMSVGKMYQQQGLVWVGRSQMVCHKDSLVYGEIDEIWYDKEIDTYFVGDTKTSSAVDKITYWYQLAIYIEILKSLNPNKNISSIGIIDWVKIKTQKWVYNRSFNEANWEEWRNKKVTSSDPVYRAKWQEKKDIPREEINKVVKRKLDDQGMDLLELAKKDMVFIQKHNISSVDVFKELLINNEEFKNENRILQTDYDSIKTIINRNEYKG